MTTFDWPNALIPQDAQLVLRKSGRQFTSPFNGSTQSVDDVAERWVLSATLPVRALASGSGLQAFCGTLAGGINRVRAWHFGSRGTPQGTLRGAPTLGVSAVRGDASISLADCAVGATLLADDMIGLGGHLLQVAANAVADGSGVMVVTLVNRIRGPVASGSVVTWYRPTADFILPAMQAGPVWQPGGIMQATALDLVEIYTP